MDREKLDRWCERGILALVISILVFAPLAYGAVQTMEFVIVQGATVVIIALWILRIWISPRPVFFWPPICWAVLAFIIYAVIRYRLAPIEYVARIELIKIFTYAFLFLAIVNNLSRQEATQIIGIVLVTVAFALSIFAVYQFITHSPRVWWMFKPPAYVGRGSGTFINPNNFAGFLEMILPLGLVYTLLSRYSHAGKIAFGYASAILMVGVGSTLSRGGWVATAAGLSVFFVVLFCQRDFRIRSLIVLGLILTLGVASIATTHKSQKRFQLLVSGESKKDDRIIYWNIAQKLWQENIWLGAGPAHYDMRFRQYRPAALQDRPDFAHNDYLNTLADWGLIGLGLILIFLALFYIGVFKTWRYVRRTSNDLERKSSNKAAFVLGGSLGVLALLVHSFVDFNLHIPANAILALTLIALVTTYLRFATESFWSSIRLPGQVALSLVGLAACFFLVDQGIRQIQEDQFLKAAEREQTLVRKLQHLQSAFAIEPQNFETAYNIGEILREQSWSGEPDQETLAKEAMTWLQRSMKLNPFYPFSYVRYGMCLDWFTRTAEAEKYFETARSLDPNGYYTTAHLGWHLLQTGDLAGAKKHFERSEELLPNSIAETYLEIIEQKMSEAAAK
ncbi:MAG: O-antigen ligase family protein [Verrucomicrobiota bacterium]